MQIWSAEIKELESLYTSLKGTLPELKKELERLVKADDENMVLVYSRRCLEVIISDLCINELKRPRKTEPLKGIIDKLSHEEKVPANIIASMEGLNSLSTFGAHPKDFDPEQVKPVLNNLATIIKWFLKYKSTDQGVSEVEEADKIIRKDLEDSVTGSEQKTDNIFRTLWKRGVPQITAGYFIASWIVIRFLDWILARYDISTRLADALLIILMAMIPSVLLYIYNRERINRGKLSLLEKIAFPSNIIITIVLVLLLSRSTDLKAMTETITVINEFGEKENRKVFKENYITKLAIFPFINESKDSTKNWLQYGIYRALWEDLLQFNYISITRNNNIIPLQEQIKFAKTNNCLHFLTGVFRITDGGYEITSRIYQTLNGSVIAERVYKGSDFFSLMDSISLQTRIDLGISKNILYSFPDLPIKEYVTDNIDAFQYFTRGLYIDSFYYNLNKAVELDSTFALASCALADNNYTYQNCNESARRDIKQAMRHRQRLSEFREISTRELYYLILGENDKAIALAEMQYKLQPDNIQLLTGLIDTYERNFIIDKTEKAYEQLNELVPNHPDYQIRLAGSYLFTGKLEKGLELLEKLIKNDPENISALIQMGEIYLHMNNLEAAEEIYKKAILLKPEHEQYWSKLLDHISYSRNNPVNISFLEPITGKYRIEFGEFNTILIIHNNHLILKGENQPSLFCYPVSDTQFVLVWAQFNNYGFVTFEVVKNDQGKVIKMICEQKDVGSWEQWKEDSLILEAEKLLDQGKTVEALDTFQSAYNQNPEHYYLANFIKHLEFIQSQEYEKLKTVFDTYLGDYGYRKLYRENNQIYYKSLAGFIFKMLPLSEDQFMLPSQYDCQIEIIKENESIRGLKIMYRDGTEEFLSRKN